MTTASNEALNEAIRALARGVAVSILDGESSQPAPVEEHAVDLGQGTIGETIRSPRPGMSAALRAVAER